MEMTLGQAEERLDVLIDAGEETGWAQVATVLAEVERGKLWAGQHHSFSAWVKSYALKKGCSESLLWKYCKAGRAYAAAREVAPELPPMGETRVSAETVINAEKINGTDAKAAARLIGQVESGRLGAKEVRDMWRATRKLTGVRTSRHQGKPGQATAGGDAEMTRRLTAALAAQAPSWIWGAESASEAEERKKAQSSRAFLTREATCIKTLAEFPVRVETAERSRQIDLAAVVVENQTTADWMEVYLWGVEVKVSEWDFRRDQKMADYSLFMDYMCLAVPVGLAATVQDDIPAEWGVLGYDPDTDRVSVLREPERLDAPRREAALMTAIVKLSREESK